MLFKIVNHPEGDVLFTLEYDAEDQLGPYVLTASVPVGPDIDQGFLRVRAGYTLDLKDRALEKFDSATDEVAQLIRNLRKKAFPKETT